MISNNKLLFKLLINSGMQQLHTWNPERIITCALGFFPFLELRSPRHRSMPLVEVCPRIKLVFLE
jgi:hypothetical protein